MADLLTEDTLTETIAQVVVPVPTSEPYDYIIENNNEDVTGRIALIPIGPRREKGIILNTAQKSTVSRQKLRKIVKLYDLPALKAEFLSFIQKAADYNISTPGEIMKAALRGFQPDNSGTDVKYYRLKNTHIMSRLTPQRAKIIDILRQTPLIAHEVLKSQISLSALKGLIDQDIIETIIKTETHPYKTPDINFFTPDFGQDQSKAVKSLNTSLQKGGYKSFLLDGVTGSGKTETFLEAAAETFKQGKQVLILMPEIGLTDQVAARFAKRFGCTPALWHSQSKERDKRLIWQGVVDGSLKCVVGARSSLFLPFTNLGLIIVDEEHDGSYKQEEGMRYHARDMAVLRASLEKIHIILASATPSLESYVNAEVGRYEKVVLRERFGGANLPDIKMINLQQHAPPSQHWISQPLKQAIEATYEKGEQSLLFINRRGYAPLMLCRACGYRVECPNCSAWMVYHHSRSEMKCHQCGQKSIVAQQCKSCGATDEFVPCGPGVERLYEEARSYFPHMRCEILSSDHQENPDLFADLLAEIRLGKVDILIGTQMIAKGHDFPNLTTVGVIDADLGLGGGDLRAGEKTFQILEQVSGRAGRAVGKQGTVYVQSYNPHHPVMEALAARDRDAFLDNEAQTRLDIGHPPFGKLAAFILSAKDHKMLYDFATFLSTKQPAAKDITIYGPAPAAMFMLRSRYRYRFLIKAKRNINIQDYIRYWLKQVKIPSQIKFHIDIDPVSFL
ncbi:MAG: primosomal protein N' [Pseudomonadota bacterium]